MTNYIMSHMSNVIEPIVINDVDYTLSMSRSSNQLPVFQVNPMKVGYVPSYSTFNNGNNVGRNNQICSNNLVNQTRQQISYNEYRNLKAKRLFCHHICKYCYYISFPH